MPRTVALTGATGFIGSTLAKHLHRTGWSVRVLIRHGADDRRLKSTPVERITGSLDDDASLARLLDGAAAVVYCAGAVRGTTAADYYPANIAGVEHIVGTAAKRTPPPRFLLISSLAAREPKLSDYAASKQTGEQMLRNNAAGMPWSILRPPAVYGPGDRELLPLFRSMLRGIAPVTGARDAHFSLIYVDDLAAAVERLLDAHHANGQTFELHDGRAGGYTWQDVVGVMAKIRSAAVLRLTIPLAVLRAVAYANLATARLFGRLPMLSPGKVRELAHPDWVCSNDTISEATGWRPAVPLEQGLRRTLDLPANPVTVKSHQP